jgi:hypothetical protein
MDSVAALNLHGQLPSTRSAQFWTELVRRGSTDKLIGTIWRAPLPQRCTDRGRTYGRAIRHRRASIFWLDTARCLPAAASDQQSAYDVALGAPICVPCAGSFARCVPSGTDRCALVLLFCTLCSLPLRARMSVPRKMTALHSLQIRVRNFRVVGAALPEREAPRQTHHRRSLGQQPDGPVHSNSLMSHNDCRSGRR